MPKFKLIGRIVGQRLPSDGLVVGMVGISLLREGEIEAITASTVTVGTGVARDFGASAKPPVLEVQSGWIARFDVEAPDSGVARTAVEAERLPRLLAAFGSTTDYPYSAQLSPVAA